MESHFRMISRRILIKANQSLGYLLQLQQTQNLKNINHLQISPSSLFYFLRSSSFFSPSCYSPSCSLKPGLFPISHTTPLQATNFQCRYKRSGPWGFVPSSNRVLRRNKEEINEILDSKRKTIQKLAKLLNCPESSVAWMVSKDTRIVTSFSQAKVEAIIQLLLGYGFSADSIMRYQCVFCWNIQTLKERIEGLLPYRKYRFSLNNVLFKKRIYDANIAMLAKEVELMGSHPSRLSFLAEVLNCNEEEIHKSIDFGHRHLEHGKISKIKSIVEQLVKTGFTKKEIMANLQVLHLDPTICADRLTKMAQTGLFSKEKMLHTLVQNKYQYPIMFNLHVSNAQALEDHRDKFAYLQSRLQCSQKEIEQLLIRAPTIKNITPRRINEILNILQGEFQLPTSTILKHYHLLFFSAKRLRHRWEILRDLPLDETDLVADLIMTEVKFTEKYQKHQNKTNCP